jgi:hypothetical protein
MVRKMFITSEDNMSRQTKWFEVADPKKIKDRVTLVNQKPLYLLVLAQKISEKEIFSVIPQQSDYAAKWVIMDSLKDNKKPEQASSMKFFYRKYVPRKLKTFFRNFYLGLTKKTSHSEELGEINPGHFKEFKED